MKFSSSQLAYLIGNREARGNLRALLRYLLTLATLITIYAILFHIIKGEGEQHSWITGFYLNALMPDNPQRTSPVLIIGAGKVGVAAARALRRKAASVHAIDRTAASLEPMEDDGVIVFPGDAADRRLLERAGIHTPRRCCSRPTTTR